MYDPQVILMDYMPLRCGFLDHNLVQQVTIMLANKNDNILIFFYPLIIDHTTFSL